MNHLAWLLLALLGGCAGDEEPVTQIAFIPDVRQQCEAARDCAVIASDCSGCGFLAVSTGWEDHYERRLDCSAYQGSVCTADCYPEPTAWTVSARRCVPTPRTDVAGGGPVRFPSCCVSGIASCPST